VRRFRRQFHSPRRQDSLGEKLKAIIANPSLLPGTTCEGICQSLLNAPPPPRSEPVSTASGEDSNMSVMQMREPAAYQSQWLAPSCRCPCRLRIAIGECWLRKTVIPYAVAWNIACRMKMTVLDIRADLERHQDRLRGRLSENAFRVGASFKNRRQHEVLDADWSASR